MTAQVEGGLASSNIRGNVAVWWVGKDMAIRGIGFSDGLWQEGIVEVVPPKSANSKSTITVLKVREKAHLWWITEKGAVWEGLLTDLNWKNKVVVPEQNPALSSRIAAVSRVPGIIDLFFISASGSVKDWFWKAETDVWEEDTNFTKRFSRFLTPNVTKDEELPLSIARMDSDIKAVSTK
jgi:hypothetical protein